MSVSTQSYPEVVVDRVCLEALDPPDTTVEWTEDDCLLYALGVGAGSVDPTAELNLTTENSSGATLQVVPTFGIILVHGGPDLLAPIGVEGKDLLLASELISLARPLPVAGRAKTSSRIVEVTDHDRGYLMTMENRVVDAEDDALLFTTRSTSLIRAGRPRSNEPPRRNHRTPVRNPSLDVTFQIAQNQCLLYRLSSGRNPLHSDPIISRQQGYETPLLHGRCTLGFAARQLITAICDGDASRLLEIGGSFSSPVFPGDELCIRISTDGESGTYDIVRPHDNVVVMKRGTYLCQI